MLWSSHSCNDGKYSYFTRIIWNRCVDSLKIIFGASSEASSAIVRLQLHGAIYRPDSFVLILRYSANLKAIRYESTSLKRIVADKSHRVIVALQLYGDQASDINNNFFLGEISQIVSY